MSTKLYEDSLKLTINKNLQDIRILLQWAEEAYETREKIQHAEQASDFLREVVETLRELQNNPVPKGHETGTLPPGPKPSWMGLRDD